MSEFQPLPEQNLPDSLTPEVVLYRTEVVAAHIQSFLTKYHGAQAIEYARLESDVMSEAAHNFEQEQWQTYFDTMPETPQDEGPLTAVTKTAVAIQAMITQEVGSVNGYRIESIEERQFMVSRLNESEEGAINSMLHVTSDGKRTSINKFELYLNPAIDEPEFGITEPEPQDIATLAEIGDRFSQIAHYLEMLAEQPIEDLKAEVDLYRTD